VLADKVRARLTFKVASSVYNLHDRSRTLGIERLF
jgi:hypothetical protein